ncbi:MAG: serine protease [Hyphomicrobiales bacterium]|nr:serine protease [Hyphomicrobiales bacterium]
MLHLPKGTIALVCLLALTAPIVGIVPARADYLSSEHWFSTKSEKSRVLLQATLVLLGHYTGLIDAEFGRLTYRALLAYQGSHRLDPDGVLSPTEEQQLLLAGAAVFKVLGFSEQTDDRAGIKVPVPVNLLVRSTPSRWGTRWLSGDGSVELETLAVPEVETTFDELLRRLSTGSNRTVTYAYTQSDLFVLSGRLGERKFYAAFIKAGSMSRGFSISWDPAVDRIGSLLSVYLVSTVAFPKAVESGGEDGRNGKREPIPSGVSAGSGFAIAADGIVVTNAHVVNDCTSLEISGYGQAAVITADEVRDLAVLRVDGRTFRSVARLKVGELKLGQEIVVVGFPLSEILGNALHVSPGAVSGLSGVGGNRSNFMVSATLQPGDSGGPILDLNGDVVGVAVAKLNDLALLNEHGTTSANIGFAINATTLLDFLKPFKVTTSEDPVPPDANVERAVAGAEEFTHQVICRK